MRNAQERKEFGNIKAVSKYRALQVERMNTALFSPCTGEYWGDWDLPDRFAHVYEHYVYEKHLREKQTIHVKEG